MSQVSLSQQLKEGNLFAEQCPSREVLKHVTSRWGVLILVALREGTHRFSDLRRKMGGVSEKMCNQVNHLIPTRVLVKGGEITCKILK